MKKMKMMKRLVTVVCVILAIALFVPAVNISASELDNKGYEMDKALLKKIKKNAIKNYPDPNSKELTWGYAASKIKEFLEADENAYLDTGVAVIENITGPITITGGTKKQRKAMKWCIDKGIITYKERLYDHDGKGDIRTKYNASEKITRWQFVDLISKIMGYGYGSRIPYLWVQEKGFTIPRETWVLDAYDLQSIEKHVIFIKASDDYLHLDDENATRDDLSRALKNLKLLAASKYTAKVVYRDKALKNYTNDDYLNDLQEIKEIIESMGMEFYRERGMDKGEFLVKNGTSGKHFTELRVIFSEKGFKTLITVNGGHGIEQYYGTKYDPKKVDVIETFKEIITKRG